ncbi:hypothetical protein V8C44DRAFT_130287 [Trichoderma aethiopicum]
MRLTFSGSHGYGYLAILVNCLFICVLNAVDLSEKLPPKGPLGVRLDYELATVGTGDEPPNYAVGSKVLVFSTHLTFNEPVSSITNGQLAQMLGDAWFEMGADGKQYGFGDTRLPSIMTFFAFGNEVILSSSQKGPSFTYDYSNSPVKESLALCMAVWKEQTGEEKRHDRGGACGEIMCAHQYYQLHNTPLRDAKVRALTAIYSKPKKKITFIAECGTGQQVSIFHPSEHQV